jgi:hypothetical protein
MALRSFALNPNEKTADYSLDQWDGENGPPHNAIKQLLKPAMVTSG